MSLIQLDSQTFDAFAKTCPNVSFMQSLEMAELLTRRGFSTYFLGLTVENDLKVAGLLYSLPMTGGLHLEINSGPISKDPAFLKAFYKGLQQFAKEQGALQLLVKPYNTYQTFTSDGEPVSPEQSQLLSDFTELGYQHDGLTTGYPGGEPDWHYVKDLSGLTPETLLASFSKKGKPLVKKASSFGIKTRALKKEELHLFKAITEATSERRDYTDKSLDYYQDFYDSFKNDAKFLVATLSFEEYLTHLKQDKNELLEKLTFSEEHLKTYPDSAKHKNTHRELSSQISTFDTRIAEAKALIEKYGQEEVILAGALFIYKGSETTYLFSGSYPEFNRFYAPAILQLQAMTDSLERGIDTYNFLGIQGIFDGSDSVLRFKQNFNGHITRKMGTFRYYPNPLKFKLLQILKKCLGR